MNNHVIKSDFLVIGSGIAGLTFSIKASTHGSVNIVTKRSLTDSATRLAQGGIAAVVSPEDSFESHIEDTLRVGCGLCHRDVVESIVRAAPAQIRDLIELGVEFCRADDDTGFDLGLEGGHS
ncbi:MAG TPA: FAD-binding protein, partial [Candidatus Thorarchaeota archaeon]|nr:FAD-binding protein [Candidatus Thorarchaeota archaeon]